MGTAIKHPVLDWVKLLFVIFDIRALCHSAVTECQSTRMSKITNDSALNLVWHRMLYSCTHMATVGVKELITSCRKIGVLIMTVTRTL